jgi:hypothetical protein
MRRREPRKRVAQPRAPFPIPFVSLRWFQMASSKMGGERPGSSATTCRTRNRTTYGSGAEYRGLVAERPGGHLQRAAPARQPDEVAEQGVADFDPLARQPLVSFAEAADLPAVAAEGVPGLGGEKD